MAGRKIPLATNEYYHIYNRGIAAQPTFWNKFDYEQAILCFSYYRFVSPPVKLSRFKEFSTDKRISLLKALEEKGGKLVEIISFVLMPNHFHLLLRQVRNNGISIFLSQTTNSYTRYFNIKHKRFGDLFQGVFKAVHVETDEQLMHLSRYIHLNPLVSFVVKKSDFLSYPWSSLADYLQNKLSFVNTQPVMCHFSSPKKYQEFVLNQADYAQKIEEIKHLLVEK